jgi:DNA topoisomerase-1
MASIKSKSLVIVESPGKIKKISSYLGDSFIVKASVGHIRDLSVGDKSCPLGVDINNKFYPKYKMLPDKKDVIQSILDVAKECDTIYVASDADREGEAIAWHIKYYLEQCLSKKDIKRIKFNEITKPALLKAIKNPEEFSTELFDAQQARRVLDRIVGFMGSDFLRNKFNENYSAGRVQSVAAKLIVDRDKDIENFKPEEYWNISSILSKDDIKFSVKYTGKINNQKDAEKIRQDLIKDSYKVHSVDAKTKKRNPLPPLITSTLQQLSSAKLGFSVKKTMDVAQSLYEGGWITYMRTDSVSLSPDSVTAARAFLVREGHEVPPKVNTFSGRDSAQNAHEAIRPADPTKKASQLFSTEDEKKLYHLIWQRFLASQMMPAVYDTLSLTIKTSSGHVLKANGRTLKSEGWLALCQDNKFDKMDDDEDVSLPNLNNGDQLKYENIIVEQKFTQPPSRYGEASLVKELEKRGIGRPATYASIIETIKGRNYVELKGKIYKSTETGRIVIDKLSDNFKFMNFDYTADMENKLDSIAEGKLTYVDMLKEFYDSFNNEYIEAKKKNTSFTQISCPICGSRTILKNGYRGSYVKCENEASCNGTISVEINEDGVLSIKKEDIVLAEGVKCALCGDKVQLKIGKYGSYYKCIKPNCVGKTVVQDK